MSGNLYLSIDFGNNPSTDTGARPYTGSTPIWENNSIWLTSDTASALPSQTQTVVYHPTDIKVRVSNDGASPISNVHVDAYVMNPFVGLASPSLALDGMVFSGSLSSVAPGSGGPDEDDIHVVTCKIQDPNLGPQPWTPSPADFAADQTSPGHLCVVANTYADGDGAAVPSSGTFNVAGDQHQGQRNIALLAAPPGPQQRVQQLGFTAITPPSGAETTLTVEQVPAGYALGQGEHWLLQSHRDISYVPVAAGGEPVLVVARHGDVGPVPLAFSRRELNAVLTVAERPVGVQARLGADQAAVTASVSVDFSQEDTGAMHVFDIVQRDGSGRALGGLRVLGVVR
jgi:hypothetical protein